MAARQHEQILAGYFLGASLAAIGRATPWPPGNPNTHLGKFPLYFSAAIGRAAPWLFHPGEYRFPWL